MAYEISDAYRERLQTWVRQEAAKRSRRKGDLGVNQYANYTEEVLSSRGLNGINASQISRWINGSIQKKLTLDVLQRLGVLMGLSDDLEMAGKLAHEWLTQDDPIPVSFEEAYWGVIETHLPARSVAALLAETSPLYSVTPLDQLSPEELQKIITEASAKLARMAKSVQATTVKPNTGTHVLLGVMSAQGLDHPATAAILGLNLERLEDILQGHAMTPQECERVAAFTGQSVESFYQWGACQLPAKP